MLVLQDHALLAELVRSRLGRSPDRIEPLPAGLGTRRFHRLHFETGSPQTLVARIEDDARPGVVPSPPATGAPSVPEAPSWHAEPPLEPLRSFLEEAGLPVPRSALHLPELGVDLLEDVGDRTLGDARGALREQLYLEACELVPRLQQLEADASAIPAFGRHFDRALVQTKAWKWLHWTIPLLLERPAREAEIVGIERLFDRIADLVLAAPLRLSHRDYKAENLHLRPPNELVLIDIQGAFLAPPEYDLVCLLYDLQQDVEEAFARDCLERIRPRLPDAPSPEQARLRFDALAVARLCKDLSHVVHAGRIRGDRRRWHELPRGLELLQRSAAGLESVFPEIRVLDSVIQALTPRVLSTDDAFRG